MDAQEPKPPPIDHQGVEDVFIEKASAVWYFYQGQWLQLQGADSSHCYSISGAGVLFVHFISQADTTMSNAALGLIGTIGAVARQHLPRLRDR